MNWTPSSPPLVFATLRRCSIPRIISACLLSASSKHLYSVSIFAEMIPTCPDMGCFFVSNWAGRTSEKIAEKLLKMGDYSSAIDLSLEWLRMRLRVGDSAGASKALHFLSSMLIEIFEKRRTKEVPLADGDWRCLRWAEKACHENLKIAKRERDNRTQALAKQR